MSEEEREKAGIKYLPTSLAEAIDGLEQDALIREVLGEHISRKYIEAKKEEWKEYCAAVSSWEIDRYLVNI